jgi:hypothetical protein
MAAPAGESCSPVCSSEPGCGPHLASRAGRTRWPAPWTCSSKSIAPRLPASAPGSGDHLGERAPIPYLKKQAEAPGARLEVNSALAAPLSLRKPERTFLVLLTPALTQPGRAGDAISKSRLYGAGSCRLTKTRTAPCSASIYPTATAPSWPKPPND